MRKQKTNLSTIKSKEKKWALRILYVLLALNLVVLTLIIVFDIHIPISSGKTSTVSFTNSSQNLETASKVDENSSIPVPSNDQEINLPFNQYAESVYLYDLDQNQALYSKNPEQVRAPASLTKVMTAIIALENTPDLENTFLSYNKAMKEELLNYGLVESDIATFDFYENEQIRMIDALYILMLRSSNDAANLIAENVSGSVDGFVELMNQKAIELGATNTHFTNPHGLDNEDHYSTAYDLFLITNYARTFPIFNTIAASSYYQIPATNMRKTVKIETYVSIQDPAYEKADFYYPYAQGIKTGYTDEAGKCLISYAEKDGHHLLIILMGEPEKAPNGDTLGYNQFFHETKAFFEWGFSFLQSDTAAKNSSE